jgi:hypothetical protein
MSCRFPEDRRGVDVVVAVLCKFRPHRKSGSHTFESTNLLMVAMMS